MKTKSKALLLALCAVFLVAASVLGTMAYLTSTDTVVNTFSVGNVAITMDEKDVDNSTEDKDRDTANEYHLLPGHEYTKDPLIHVGEKSENCYLFVTITNGIAAIEANGATVADQMAANGWIAIGEGSNVYVYVGTAEGATAPLAVAAGASIPVFETITISGAVDNATLAAYEGETIVVNAYAVQVDGFENATAATIWSTAFPS